MSPWKREIYAYVHNKNRVTGWQIKPGSPEPSDEVKAGLKELGLGEQYWAPDDLSELGKAKLAELKSMFK